MIFAKFLNTIINEYTIIIFGVIWLIFMARMLSLVNPRYKNFLTDLSNNIHPSLESAKLDKKFPSFAKNWKRYQDTMNEDLRTDRLAEEFFTPTVLYPGLKINQILPGVFIGLGILGTFAGLGVGLGSFDSTNVDEIRSSINGMVNGMSDAFGTSLVGLSLSVIWTLIMIPINRRLNQKTTELCEHLDKVYYEDPVERFFLYKDTEGESVAPGDALAELVRSNHLQAESLSNFKTDVADAVKNIADEIILHNQQAIADQFMNMIRPLFEKIDKGIDSLVQQKQNSAAEFVEQVVFDLKSALGEMIQDLKTTVSSDTKQELEGLANMLSQAGSSLQKIPNEIGYSADILKNMSNELLEGVTTLVEDIRDAMNPYRAIIEANGKYLEKYQNLQIGLENIANNMRGVTEKLEESTTTFSRDYSVLKDQTQKLGNEAVESIESLTDAADTLKSTVSDYQEVGNSIGNVFNSIQKNVNDYSQTVGKSLNELLAEYTTSLREFSGRMSSAISNLEDQIDEVNENVEAIQNNERTLVSEAI